MSDIRSGNSLLVLLLSALLIVSNSFGQEPPSRPKPVPRMQVIPMPYDQASFQRDGVELTRYHFGPGLHRPFLFPVIGPSGVSLTRMGHPRDPESHSHHNSVWISHNSVNDIDFWSDRGKGTVRHKRIVELEDSDEYAHLIAENEWVTTEGKVLMLETRRVMVLPLADSEWLLIIDMEFKAKNQAVTLGKTPFGMIGVRMAKTIGVHDGGGRILNSAGQVNEVVPAKEVSTTQSAQLFTAKAMFFCICLMAGSTSMNFCIVAVASLPCTSQFFFPRSNPTFFWVCEIGYAGNIFESL